MSEKKLCPCCGRHCDLSEPHCGRGKEYARTGVIPQHEHSHGRPQSIIRSENYKSMSSDNKLIMNLRDLGHMLRFLFEGKGSQKRILILLNESGTVTQRELTEKLGIQPGSASEVIGKLENAGLIHRTPSAEDRRTAEINLTEIGIEKAHEAAHQRKKRHQEMFSALSEDEKETLLNLLEKLNADWENRYHDHEKHFAHHGSHGNDCRPHEHGHRGENDFHERHRH